MSAQRLSERSCHRIALSIGEPVLRGWSHGGYWFGFVTPDHRHGSWNKISGQVEWDDPSTAVHYTSCRETEWEPSASSWSVGRTTGATPTSSAPRRGSTSVGTDTSGSTTPTPASHSAATSTTERPDE